MKRIKLSNCDEYTLVDDEDYERLSKFSWHKTQKDGYAAGAQSKPMHRIILGLQTGNKLQVDHKNRDHLDNRKENLRVCNRFQNAQNTQRKRMSGPYRGVRRSNQKWCAAIVAQGKEYYLGLYSTPELAALAYNKAAKKYHKAFAILNVIRNPRS